MYRLDVPFIEKDDAKGKGARWNPQGRFWYCEELTDELRRWYREDENSSEQPQVPNVTETHNNGVTEIHNNIVTQVSVADNDADNNDPYSDYKTVSKVNKEISDQFNHTDKFRSILVRGEVTNFNGVNKGNYYFDIKDEEALLPCILWGTNAESVLTFELEKGKEVAIIGTLKFRDQKGTCSLHVSNIADIGAGKALLQYNQLMEKLRAEGLFDQDHKKDIPKFPTRVGIVTSKGGQAIQDIQKVARKRNPYVQLILYHVNVQGQNAVRTIIEGIKALDALNLDTIIVGRGGGSDEELIAYNDENVARAVYEANTPIVSAVGHEGNRALIDYVSDHRAATPSEAAEDSIPDIMTTVHRVEQLKKGITDNMRSNLQKRKSRLDTQKARLAGNDPARVLKEKKDKLQVLSDGLKTKIVMIYDTKKNRYRVLVTRLNGLSPTAKLIHGFGYITSGDDPVMSINDVSIGEEVSIRIHDGQIKTTVNDIIGT